VAVVPPTTTTSAPTAYKGLGGSAVPSIEYGLEGNQTDTAGPTATRVPSFAPSVSAVPSFRPSGKKQMMMMSWSKRPTPSPSGDGGNSKEIESGSGASISPGAAAAVAIGASAVVLFGVLAAKRRRDTSAARSGGYYWGQSSVNSSFVDSNVIVGLGPSGSSPRDDPNGGGGGGGAGDADHPDDEAAGTVEARHVDEPSLAAASTSGYGYAATPTSASRRSPGAVPPPWRSEPLDDDGSFAMPSFEDGV
jgi:hypothetical protein